jgi:hypothetical protein
MSSASSSASAASYDAGGPALTGLLTGSGRAALFCSCRRR